MSDQNCKKELKKSKISYELLHMIDIKGYFSKEFMNSKESKKNLDSIWNYAVLLKLEDSFNIRDNGVFHILILRQDVNDCRSLASKLMNKIGNLDKGYKIEIEIKGRHKRAVQRISPTKGLDVDSCKAYNLSLDLEFQ